MSKRILIITQNVGKSARLLEFFSSWVREFTRTNDHVTVITLEASEHAFPSNVTVVSLGKERGVSRIMRWGKLVAALAHYVPKVDGVFAHMSPVFAIAAWPWCLVWRKRLVLWYLHRSMTMRLRLAYMMCDALVTADPASLQIRGSNVVGVGHGIDADRFVEGVAQVRPHHPLRILCVGRLSPIKRVDLLLEALSILKQRGFVFEARIVGAPLMASDHEYHKSLVATTSEHGLNTSVTFAGYVAHDDLPAQYRWADVTVGLTPPGGIDKVLLEAMASGCSIVTTNTVMRSHVGGYAQEMVVDGASPEQIAQAIASVPYGVEVSQELVNAVRKNHDVCSTVGRIVNLL